MKNDLTLLSVIASILHFYFLLINAQILKSQPDTEVVLTREKPVKWKTANSTVYDPFGPPPEIGLTNISYLYPGKEKVNDRIAIDNVSLTIPSGSYVAIVGPPGTILL